MSIVKRNRLPFITGLVAAAAIVGLLAGGCSTPKQANSQVSVANGAMLWGQNCGRCHNYRSPNSYSDAQWTVAVHHMRLRVPLTGEQQQAILEFLKSSD